MPWYSNWHHTMVNTNCKNIRLDIITLIKNKGYELRNKKRVHLRVGLHRV